MTDKAAEELTKERSGPRLSWTWALLVVISGASAMGYAIYRIITG